MILKVYAIHDHAAGAYMVPHFMASHGLMNRAFSDAINDPQSNLHKHPDDYRLYYIGTYDDATGTLTPVKPELLSRGTDFITHKEN